jgi:hypothetical protein
VSRDALRLCETCCSNASRHNISACTFFDDEMIPPAALVAYPPAFPLIIVAVVVPEARGFVTSYGNGVVSEFVKGLKGFVGDDVAVRRA